MCVHILEVIPFIKLKDILLNVFVTTTDLFIDSKIRNMYKTVKLPAEKQQNRCHIFRVFPFFLCGL